MSVRGLAEVASISASFLSQVEKGSTNMSIGRMIDIANALRVPIESLLGTRLSSGPQVTTRAERPVLSEENGSRKTLITRQSTSPMEVYSAELDVGGSTGADLYIHGDQDEVIIVIKGNVNFQVGKQLFTMTEGDSLEFRSSTPHRAHNVGDTKAEVLWVIGAPSGFIEFVQND